jgi:hypothetical protein
MSLDSGIRKKTYSGSRGQKGTRSQIPDPDPQHRNSDVFLSLKSNMTYIALLNSDYVVFADNLYY